MKIKSAGLLLMSTLIISSCSPKNPEEKSQGVLSDAQQHTLDKAKETEDVLKKVDEERLKKLDEAEGK